MDKLSSKFIHLHTHSHYSLLDGMTKLPIMVDIAKKQGMGAIALTDHGNMFGAIEFYKLCKDAGIKPIIGVEAYMTSGSRHDRGMENASKRYHHLILLAKNLQGYKNLMRLVSISNLEGYYYKPRMDKEILRKYGEGIICLSGCMGGELSQTILKEDFKKADELIKEYQDIFGSENYFIEVQAHPTIENDKKLRNALVALGKKHSVTVVATQDSHYPCQDDHEAHNTLLAINTGADGKTEAKFEFSKDDFSLIDEKTALQYFEDYPETVANTKIVADMVESFEIELGVPHFPHFVIESGLAPDEELKKLAYAGFAVRKLEQSELYVNRLEYELGIIKQKGYASYFLVVGDLLRYAHENNILTNIRGSVAGSLTTFLLKITNVDPIDYKLPFERFLNPDRPSLPDIDMDYADDRRDEIIAYAKQKYGEDRVAQIATFGTMMAKGSVRDVARALGYPYSVGDRISTLIPMGSQGFPMTIDHALETVPELKTAYEKEADTKKIINLAKRIEGCVRHVSVHAAGVVIAPRPLYEFTPVQKDPKGDGVITQYDMYQIEDVGLPKFDFLGIRNLAILAGAVKLAEKINGNKIDLDNVDLADKRTFKMLAVGDTIGLFQLNGSGMTQYLKQLRPTSIHDINAMVALYRPGPIQFIPLYIERKHNPLLVKYLDPALEPILKQTYGVLVYQDDLLLISIHIAGYTWGEADKFRKAVGKKIPEEMEKQKEHFITGCVEHSKWPLKKAQELWSQIEPFAAYGFNKAHSASYGRVAYQTAFMKANYPVEYMCAVLTAESGDVDKIAEIINDCKHMNIKILPPDINESFRDFTVIKSKKEITDESEEGIIRFGLYTIKNLGSDIGDAIVAERKAGGKFKDLTDVLNRVRHKNLNKKSLEALIKTGAMDSMGERGTLIANMEKILEYNKGIQNANLDQGSLFGSMQDVAINKLQLEDYPKATKEEKLGWEKELLGLYISGHPLDRIREKLESKPVNIKKIKEDAGNGMSVTIAGMISEVRVISTKKGDEMAFIKMMDFSGTIEAVVFPKLFAVSRVAVAVDKIIAIKAKVTIRNEEKSLAIEEMKEI